MPQEGQIRRLRPDLADAQYAFFYLATALGLRPVSVTTDPDVPAENRDLWAEAHFRANASEPRCTALEKKEECQDRGEEKKRKRLSQMLVSEGLRTKQS